jgi:hypothetical protein
MDLRQELATEFAQRRERNAHYSLRAYARDLRTDHASLSQILRGRRALSARMATFLGRRLGIGGSMLIKAAIRQNAVAILTLIRSGKFQPNCRWIAVRTGIPLDEINAALTQLLSNGVLEMHSSRGWEIRKNNDHD